MRVRAFTAVVGVAAAGVVCAPQAFAHRAHPDRALPRVIFRDYSGIEPRDVFFSGDGGNIVTGLRWRWNETSAVGHGISDIQGCVPNCASGTQTPVKTTVTFSRPVNGHFTKIVEIRVGERLVGYYDHPSWPEGAR